MSNMDFNDADPQRAGSGDLIPDGTVATVVATIRPGGFGPGNWLKNSTSGECLMADFEFTVDGGDHDRRKFWSLFVTEGQTDGQQKAASITRSRLRAMLESAHGVRPDDGSPDAVGKRRAAGWDAFNGLRFCARIGVEKGGLKDKTAGPNSERYADKNVLKAAVTPEDPEYVHPGAQHIVGSTGVAQPAGQPSSQAKAAAKPSWAA